MAKMSLFVEQSYEPEDALPQRKFVGQLHPVVGRYQLTDEQAKLPIETLTIMLAENRLSTGESEETKKARSEAGALREAREVAGKPPVS